MVHRDAGYGRIRSRDDVDSAEAATCARPPACARNFKFDADTNMSRLRKQPHATIDRGWVLRSGTGNVIDPTCAARSRFKIYGDPLAPRGWGHILFT